MEYENPRKKKKARKITDTDQDDVVPVVPIVPVEPTAGRFVLLKPGDGPSKPKKAKKQVLAAVPDVAEPEEIDTTDLIVSQN